MSTVRLEPFVQSVALYPLRYHISRVYSIRLDSNKKLQSKQYCANFENICGWLFQSRKYSLPATRNDKYKPIKKQLESNHKYLLEEKKQLCANHETIWDQSQKSFWDSVHSMYIFAYCNAEIL